MSADLAIASETASFLGADFRSSLKILLDCHHNAPLRDYLKAIQSLTAQRRLRADATGALPDAQARSADVGPKLTSISG